MMAGAGLLQGSLQRVRCACGEVQVVEEASGDFAEWCEGERIVLAAPDLFDGGEVQGVFVVRDLVLQGARSYLGVVLDEDGGQSGVHFGQRDMTDSTVHHEVEDVNEELVVQ
jgi:hypothetical protein